MIPLPQPIKKVKKPQTESHYVQRLVTITGYDDGVVDSMDEKMVRCAKKGGMPVIKDLEEIIGKFRDWEPDPHADALVCTVRFGKEYRIEWNKE
jgi:hypothetical protein